MQQPRERMPPGPRCRDSLIVVVRIHRQLTGIDRVDRRALADELAGRGRIGRRRGAQGLARRRREGLRPRARQGAVRRAAGKAVEDELRAEGVAVAVILGDVHDRFDRLDAPALVLVRDRRIDVPVAGRRVRGRARRILAARRRRAEQRATRRDQAAPRALQLHPQPPPANPRPPEEASLLKYM